ncbi:MAG: hypothetical protein QOC95_2234 [Thermoleophilaceae bacterium]|jgi:pSer/pThr/pTyr-binding forkhead associated (FHA) protein|nr:hypothetical protein [Thermoleophilaceae bacterium]
MRVSDQRREQTVAALRDRALAGSLTLDSFAGRVDAAYRARTDEELDILVADLPARRGRLRALGAALRRGVAGIGRRPVPPGAPAVEIEVLVPRLAEAVTVGRSQDCDVVVGEETVSRFHAELRHGADDDWTVRDLDSTNGTWLNGSRVREARVCRGDVLRLGGLRLDLRF